MVDAVDHRRVDFLAGAEIRTFRAPAVNSADAFALLCEKTGAFQRHVDALIGHLGRIAFCGYFQGAVDLAVVANGDGVARNLDLARKAAMHAVIGKEMGVGLDAAEIVDGDGNDIVPAALDDGAQHQAPDASKSVDRNFDCHDLLPFRCWLSTHQTHIVTSH